MQHLPLSPCFSVVQNREGFGLELLLLALSLILDRAFADVYTRGGTLHCLPRQALFLVCRNRYWQLDTYMLPVCTLTAIAGDSRAPAAEEEVYKV